MSATPRHASAPLTGLLVVCSVIVFAAVLTAPSVFMVDDAWFYLQIAQNLADGSGSTFDGLTPTDGYHPLWMGLLTAVLWPFQSHEHRLYAGVVLQIGLATATLWGARHLARTGRFAFPEVVVVTLLLSQFAEKGWMTEGPLTAGLHIAVLLLATRNRPVLTGLFMGLLFLARLDTVFFLAAVFVFHPRKAPVLAAAATTIAPWVIGHFLWTGHLVPVSGAIKSTFPVPDFTDPLAKLGWTGMFAVAGSLAGLFVSRGLNSEQRRILTTLSIGGLVHGLYVTLFTAPRWSTFVAYYWITGLLATGLTAGQLLGTYLDLLPSLAPGVRRRLALCLVGFLGISGAVKAGRSAAADTVDPTIALAEWAADALPPGSRLLALDAPGRLAWFSGHPVIAIDGLTQDHGFSDALREQGLEHWAADHGITHVLTYAVTFDAPWCATIADDHGLLVTYKTPDDRQRVYSHRFTTPPIKTLTDFDDDDINWASLYAWPGPDAFSSER